MVPADPPLLLWKKTCDTCRRFKAALEAAGVHFGDREINARPLQAAELDALIGDRPVKPFLNTHNEVYRAQGLAKNPPTKAQAVALIAEHNNLLRRPVLIVGETVLTGNDLPGARRLLGLD